jgi:hydrogenase/urease accessory protein HupE
VRRVLLLLSIALAFVASLATDVLAHPEALLTATAVLRRDGTFEVELRVDREQTPMGFGRKAPVRDVDGIPAAADVRAEANGVLAAFDVLFDGAPAPFRARWAPSTDEAKMQLVLVGDVPPTAAEIAFRNDLPFGPWAASVRREGEEGASLVLLDPKAPMTPVGLRLHAEPTSLLATAAEFVGHGFTHIVPRGLDHMLFVLGLFLVAARVRPLLAQVTAFTAAHTATLALSTTGVVRLPSSVVEPLIAASIVYVAVENLWTERVRAHRIALVFAFGLLHGLGFAGALADLGLPADRKATALLSFNVGVELGQLSVLAVAWTLVAWPLRDQPWYRARVVVPASLAIAGVGLWWAIARIAAG